MCFVHKILGELSEISPCYIVKCLINSKNYFNIQQIPDLVRLEQKRKNRGSILHEQRRLWERKAVNTGVSVLFVTQLLFLIYGTPASHQMRALFNRCMGCQDRSKHLVQSNVDNGRLREAAKNSWVSLMFRRVNKGRQLSLI